MTRYSWYETLYESETPKPLGWLDILGITTPLLIIVGMVAVLIAMGGAS